MARIRWKIKECPFTLWRTFLRRLNYAWWCVRSLTYNHHLTQSYAADVCIEPIISFVTEYTYILGPVFVVMVIVLISSVVFIAYWLGLPYWWETSRPFTVLLILIGNWILLNVVFHYYKAVTTPPGVSPDGGGALISTTSSFCKKCIAPKAARAHHCSVCKKCILKMDHHCPWLNNCVGYGNHRYFYLFVAYTALGSLFVMAFGFTIGLAAMHNSFEVDAAMAAANDAEPLHGHPVKINETGHLIPVTDIVEYDEALGHLPAEHHDLPVPKEDEIPKRKKEKETVIILTTAFVIVATFLALTALLVFHGSIITRGETCIESHINKSEAKRFATLGEVYRNPYDFGAKENWRRFLGLVNGRTFRRHVLLPSGHNPYGDGIQWATATVEQQTSTI